MCAARNVSPLRPRSQRRGTEGLPSPRAGRSGLLGSVYASPDLARVFQAFWVDKGVRVGGEAPDKNVPGVPPICALVPHLGGRTFIAENARDTAFSADVFS